MLLGREAESARIEQFVTTVADGGGDVLRLLGEPGVGKTVLLDRAAELAAGRGVRVVRLAGVQSEAGLPFAAVQRLLQALRVPVASLPPLQRQALGVAFGDVDGPPPDRFRIGAALRAALVVAAAEAPVRSDTPDPTDGEFDALDPDADEALRRDLAERMTPYLRRIRTEHPAVMAPDTDAPRGARFVGEVTAAALEELYNPAQIDVMRRVALLLAQDPSDGAET